MQHKEIAVKDFQRVARLMLDLCGNKDNIHLYLSPHPCLGCPAFGQYGGEYQECVFNACLDVN